MDWMLQPKEDSWVLRLLEVSLPLLPDSLCPGKRQAIVTSGAHKVARSGNLESGDKGGRGKAFRTNTSKIVLFDFKIVIHVKISQSWE